MGDNGQFLFLGNVISETLGLIARDLRLILAALRNERIVIGAQDGEG